MSNQAIAGVEVSDSALEAATTADLTRVEALLHRSVASDYEFVTETSLHLIDAGHFPTEDVICEPLVAYLQRAFPTAIVMKTAAHDCEAIQYCIKEK